ncbi:winged helix-turn-helix transcriptional regulator [Stappia sp. F7233]|uniref:Winged helix-turn-helix transcriptional regulator n=1 Tax=Stappia albiluteola TaxID=2758565 RepID=A0A839ADH7_9HYPH|nr:MarR family winged helix-turn-helix transcriptional regulator [Stappia albiluteola]MBA5777196.1 winged helix-turn-helix transcriptional regulator [Stappia albiluteola]
MQGGDRFIDGYLLYLLARASSIASAEFHQEIRRCGYTVAHWRVLAALKGIDGVTVGDLADICLANQPAISKTIEKLVGMGLVERSSDDTDRRRVRVCLTRDGDAAVDLLIAAAREHQARLVDAMGHDETTALVRALTRVIERSVAG